MDIAHHAILLRVTEGNVMHYYNFTLTKAYQKNSTWLLHWFRQRTYHETAQANERSSYAQPTAMTSLNTPAAQCKTHTFGHTFLLH
jgi:hypothetical protein